VIRRYEFYGLRSLRKAGLPGALLVCSIAWKRIQQWAYGARRSLMRPFWMGRSPSPRMSEAWPFFIFKGDGDFDGFGAEVVDGGDGAAVPAAGVGKALAGHGSDPRAILSLRRFVARRT
jgi:hypothetical protein